MFIDDLGRVKGTTIDPPSASEVTGKAASVTSGYYVGVDDKWVDSPHNLTHNTITNNAGESWNYKAEWYLLCDASNGSSFQIGEVVTQVLDGDDFTAICTGFEAVDSYRFSWKNNLDITTTAVLTIKDAGPTGGTGGPTGPLGGTGGTSGVGPIGPQGGSQAVPITGQSSAASWNVIGVSKRISVSTIGNHMKQYELDLLEGACYAHIQYAQGVCLDLSSSITQLGDLFEQVKLNHDIYGTADAVNSTKTVTVYDANRVSYTINAISGGTPDAPTNSQLRTLYHNWLKADDADGASRDLIEDAYKGIGGDTLDSVHKLRTYFEGRNA